MSAPAWTPGPWEVEVHELSSGLSGIVYDRNGYRIGTDHLTPADARLIAAAPDLAEALDWLLASIEADPKDERYPGDREERLTLACGAARTALAKARAE